MDRLHEPCQDFETIKKVQNFYESFSFKCKKYLHFLFPFSGIHTLKLGYFLNLTSLGSCTIILK